MSDIRVGRRADPGAQYIGRGSALGNPFVMTAESQRAAVCEKYQLWFDAQVAAGNPSVMAQLSVLYRLARQGSLVLGCYCAPRQCHGDTIKRFLTDLLDSP